MSESTPHSTHLADPVGTFNADCPECREAAGVAADPLDDHERRRVRITKAARDVLASRGFASVGSVTPYDVIVLSRYIETGEIDIGTDDLEPKLRDLADGWLAKVEDSQIRDDVADTWADAAQSLLDVINDVDH